MDYVKSLEAIDRLRKLLAMEAKAREIAKTQAGHPYAIAALEILAAGESDDS